MMTTRRGLFSLALGGLAAASAAAILPAIAAVPSGAALTIDQMPAHTHAVGRIHLEGRFSVNFEEEPVAASALREVTGYHSDTLVHVKLDGAERNFVVTADTTESWIEELVTWPDGSFVIDGDSALKQRRYGRVEIYLEPRRRE